MKCVKHTNAALHTPIHHAFNKMTYVMEQRERYVRILQKIVRLAGRQFITLITICPECKIMLIIVKVFELALATKFIVDL
jgi:hypothetical protein